MKFCQKTSGNVERAHYRHSSISGRRGSSQRIGSTDNGNFLGLIELLSKYDPILKVHVEKVSESQQSGTRLAAHYLSSDSQNEFIATCAHQVRTIVIEKLKRAKYFSIIVDATPDASHAEQTTFMFQHQSKVMLDIQFKNLF